MMMKFEARLAAIYNEWQKCLSQGQWDIYEYDGNSYSGFIFVMRVSATNVTRTSNLESKSPELQLPTRVWKMHGLQQLRDIITGGHM